MTANCYIEYWRDGLALAKYPRHEGINSMIKQVPGTRWGGHIKPGCWIIPEEISGDLLAAAKRQRWQTSTSGIRRSTPQLRLNKNLYSFQVDAVKHALRDSALLVSFETGLGKTPTAIECLRHTKPARTLVITPAMVRGHWGKEFDKWWKGHPDVGMLTGKASISKVRDYPVIVSSYEGVKHVADLKYDAVVIDEAHYIQNAKDRSGREVKRSSVVRQLVWKSDPAFRLGLTATPITNRPEGLWHQLHTLWPNRFRDFWTFVRRYVQIGSNEWTDWLFEGLNHEHADELRARLGWCMERRTKKEVAHLLPPCTVTPVRVRAPRTFNVREVLDRFNRQDMHNASMADVMRSTGSIKIKSAVDHASVELEATNHVAILSYYRATAREIGEAMAAKHRAVPVTVIDGSMTVEQREATLDAHMSQPRGVMVATIDSIKVGIDLTFNGACVFAELSTVPEKMIQAFGRFSRLSGTIPSKILLLILEGTQDEAIAHVLMKRVDDINRVVEEGEAEANLTTALKYGGQSEEEFLAELQEATSFMLEEDEYV